MTELSAVTRIPLDKGQRFGVVLLVCLTLGIIAISFLQIRSSIFSPLKKSGATVTTNNQTQSEEEILKKRDTDKDEVTDYDEIYVFHTSPYIRDTDSDGTSDGEEIKRGSNPLCPEGKDCSTGTALFAPSTNTVSSTTVGVGETNTPTMNLAAPLAAPAAIGAPTPSSSTASTAVLPLTPTQLRSILIEQGIPKNKVDEISDADLLKLLAEAQAEFNKNSALPSQIPKQP